MQLVLVTGGRDLTNLNLVWSRLNTYPSIDLLIHGANPKGADCFASSWAYSRGIYQLRVPAEWDRYGKSAGHKRNSLMIDLCSIYRNHDYSVVVEAFPTGGPGTRDCMRKAKEAGLHITENFQINPQE